MGNLLRLLKLISKYMYSIFKDFFLMVELLYDSYIELDIGFSGV